MRFQPQTDEQIADAGLLPENTYDVEVFDATEKQSKSGNEMIVLELRVFTDGGHRDLTDYVVSNLAWKVKGAAKGFGLLAEYESGELTANDFLGKSGRAKIGKQPANGDFGPKNVIKNYEPKMQASAPMARASSGAAMDDDIPFAAEFR